MRTRVLIATLAVVAAPVLLTVAPVGASAARSTSAVVTAQAEPEAEAEADEPELNEAAEECIHEIEEANSIDVDCQEAPSPILPPLNELIWGAISFTIVFVLLGKLAFPAIKKGMEGRTEKIRSDLAEAESAKSEAADVLAGYQAQLADARTESARIIEEARQKADELKTSLQAKAESDIAEQRQKATADIESAKAQAIADLRGEVTALAIGAAQEVIGGNLDTEANRRLVDDYIDQVGAAR